MAGHTLEKKLWGNWQQPAVQHEYQATQAGSYLTYDRQNDVLTREYGEQPSRGKSDAGRTWNNMSVSIPAAGAPSSSLYDVYSPGTTAGRRANPSTNDPSMSFGSQLQPYSATRNVQFGASELPNAPAGSYNHNHPEDIPRSGRGLYAISGMCDSVADNFSPTAQHSGQTDYGSRRQSSGAPPLMAGYADPNSPTRNDRPGQLVATYRNGDSLETFMTGIGARSTGPKDKLADFDNYYGKQHAGKMTASHIKQDVTGLEGPATTLDYMPHMRTDRQCHQGQLESSREGGYVPTSRAAQPGSHFGSGLRMFPVTHNSSDNLTMSSTGLMPGSGKEASSIHIVQYAKAKANNITMGDMGLSHSGKDAGYPNVRQVHLAHLHSSTVLTGKDVGITQAGEQPDRRGPFAGLTSQSCLRSSTAGIVAHDANQRTYTNPHAGKGTASHLTHSSGTVTLLPMDKPETRRLAVGQDGWTTTYDDMYSAAQATRRQVQHREATIVPEKF